MEEVRELKWSSKSAQRKRTEPVFLDGFACWKSVHQYIRSVLTTYSTCYDDNSEVFKSFTWNQRLQESIPQRNWFLTRNRFRGIDAWGFLKVLKFRFLGRFREKKGRGGWEKSTPRVAMSTFWRTLNHDGKISPAWWGWGSLFTLCTITSKTVVYAQAERADTLLLFLLYPYMYSVDEKSRGEDLKGQ